MTILEKLEEVENKFQHKDIIWLYDDEDNQLTDALEEAFKEMNIENKADIVIDNSEYF